MWYVVCRKSAVAINGWRTRPARPLTVAYARMACTVLSRHCLLQPQGCTEQLAIAGCPKFGPRSLLLAPPPPPLLAMDKAQGLRAPLSTRRMA